MVHFSKSGFFHKSIHLLMIMLTGSILSSCSGGLVKKDIIVEDCIKIPKQDGTIIVYTDEDNNNYLDLKLKVENIKTLKESDIHRNFQIEIGLYDKDDVELIYVVDDLSRDFFTKNEGYKSFEIFSLTLGNSNRTREDLEKIKDETQSIKIKSSKILKTIKKQEVEKQTSQQLYRFKVEYTPIETTNYVKKIDVTPSYTTDNGIALHIGTGKEFVDINMVHLETTMRLKVIDANGNHVLFDPDKDYENIVIPFKSVYEFFYNVTRDTFGIQTMGTYFKVPQDGMAVLNKRIEMLEKYVNYVWDLPLTNQPIDTKIKEILNRNYYDLDLKNHSIIEISRSYNKVTYGLLENDKLFYNPNDLPQIVIERYPDSILGIKLLFSVVCYKGDKYPPEQTIESR